MTENGGNNGFGDEARLAELLQTFSDEIDSEITTPPLQYFTKLVDETLDKRHASVWKTLGFMVVVLGAFAALSLLGRAGYLFPVAAVLVGTALFSPLLLLWYLPLWVETEG